jgi:hypothetical protein
VNRCFAPIEALPNASTDLEREVEAATAEAANRIVRRAHP